MSMKDASSIRVQLMLTCVVGVIRAPSVYIANVLPIHYLYCIIVYSHFTLVMFSL